jgi:hypothetical protein
MTIKIDSLLSLTASDVQDAAEQLGAMLEEYAPEVDARRGALGALLVRLTAVLAVKRETEFDRLQRSQSFSYVLADPTLADDDIVDAAASNFRRERLLGGNATGQVTIVVDRLQTVVVAAGTQFTASGRTFTTDTAYAARTSDATVQSTSDRVLTPLPDGRYAFTITVVDTETGTAGQLRKDTLLSVDPVPLSFVKAFAAEDFTGGTDTETNAELLNRLITGVTSQTMSDRPSMRAALFAVPEFSRCVASSIVGFGMAEMLRDRHSLWPGSTGGRVDWYVRTQPSVQNVLTTKTATLISLDDTGYGVWQIEFDRDEAAGVFDVRKIVASGSDTTDSSSFEIVEDIRGTDLTAISGCLLPDITDSLEAVYSRFQTIVVRFIDSDTPAGSLALGTTADYDCVLRTMPLIADISDHFTTISRLHAAGDLLVKAPVPCFLTISMTVQLRPDQESPDTDAIKTDIVAMINSNYSFTGRLPVSAITEIVHNYLPVLAGISAIDIFGEIRQPNGTTYRFHSSELLVVPERTEVMSSGRTVAFFAATDSITIDVVTVDVPET